jgi:hypothetical protein
VWGDPIIEKQNLPGFLGISPFIRLEQRRCPEFQKQRRHANQEHGAEGDAVADPEE